MNWIVTNLFTVNQPEQGYVVTALYNVVQTDGQYSAEMSGCAQFNVEGSTFIPYEELTNDIVVGWIQQELGESGIESIEACLNGQIETQKNPPISPENTPLPWN
jgi:hypothetical protein